VAELRLRPLRDEDEGQAVAAHEELARDDFAFLLDWDPRRPWREHVTMHADWRCGRGLPVNRVPATFLVADVGGELVGRVSIRHELNDRLREYGGHIGYGVRHAHRRLGYATEMLRQSLVVARAVGVDRVLVTCDDANAASAVVIERLGGLLDDVRLGDDGVAKRRYWIT
jgi:predicted acetyltransferase